MKKLLGLAFILLSIAAAIPASAQSFGKIFPVSNTRYATAPGTSRLAANGRDFFLFWSSERKIRATSLAQDGARVGHVVLDTNSPFDVAWTGETFLAVSSRPMFEGSWTDNIIGRVLDAEARPLGEELALVGRGQEPRIAAGPESIVMVYRDKVLGTRVMALGLRGENTGREIWTISPGGRPAIAGNGDGFAIALSNADGLRVIMLDRKGRAVSERTLPRPTIFSDRQVALATDGSRYLLVWSNSGEVAAATIGLNGSFGTPRLIETASVSTPTAAWTGTGWSISYRSPTFGPQSRARVVQLDPSGQTITASEESGVAATNPSVAAVNGHVMAAWNAGGASSVVELPLAANEPRLATYAATQQTILTTASSSEATLIVWREQSETGASIRSGLRTHDGLWTERELTTGSGDAVAASDGNQFVVIVAKGSTQELIRLDRNGRPLGSSMTVPGSRTVIAWNGTHYAIVTASDGLQGLLLSPAGVLSPPVAIRNDPPDDSFGADSFSGRLSLASNGDGFLLAGETFNCPFLLCSTSGVRAMRLSASLRRIDNRDLPLDDVFGILAGAVWNGSEYVVAWRASESGIHTARVPASAGSPATIARPFSDILATGVASMPDGTIVIVGPAGDRNVLRGAILRPDGSIAQSFDLDASTVTGRPLLTRLPDGIAVVASSVQDAEPHHGTSHVMMAIARSSVTPPPAAPYVHARLKDGVVLVDWSSSAGTLNGYRLEYRVDDGSWNELDEWFSPGSHHRAIRASSETDFEIRMRAFNDGGASEYSATAMTKPIRRRAAAH